MLQVQANGSFVPIANGEVDGHGPNIGLPRRLFVGKSDVSSIIPSFRIFNFNHVGPIVGQNLGTVRALTKESLTAIIPLGLD